MRNKLKEVTREPVTKDKCRHYWMIESARGPTSQGVCKFCGAKKEFHNSWLDFTVTRRSTSVFDLPELPDIELDRERDDSELEKSSASL